MGCEALVALHEALIASISSRKARRCSPAPMGRRGKTSMRVMTATRCTAVAVVATAATTVLLLLHSLLQQWPALRDTSCTHRAGGTHRAGC